MVAIPNDILGFWRNAGARQWYAAKPAFDSAIRLKFEPVHHAAARGEYDKWAATAEGTLALLILLDQFPRNMYRKSGHAFATDPKARALARDAAERGWHLEVEPEMRQFMLLPFEHSEDIADQDYGLILAEEVGDAEVLKWVNLHRDIIVRFGRFPHRNPALGRATTAEEQAFLDDGGFAG
ncbi:MAG: DUF924 family protein [Alphaproteobacteria bacterium]|nr:DUF924 family protein [Alphaproteobacteria bacterium]MBU1515434.1 DUF924 family protein [Alphaproteobacteria bacterium]MBU2095432.1 DUF924 family protein [Alphaproteobacteria bacterium]MBU2150674.1 DUF924 family protein [Alphaproteobacteria bacterium]MBU2306938.1 DUF924 family protein [Alphaproteobacteria bacterium]